MQQFDAGSLHTAKAAMHNPTSKGFQYTGMLFLGIDQLAKSEIDFWLGANETRDISFIVAMPSVAGVYPVYIGVFSGGLFLEPLRQGEDVSIVVLPTTAFTFSSGTGEHSTCPSATAYWYPKLWWTINNLSGAPVTHTLKLLQMRHSHTYNQDDGPFEISGEGYGYFTPGILTIPAGGSYSYYYNGSIWYAPETRYVCHPAHMMHHTYTYWLEDELGNKSPEVSLYRP